MAQTTGTLNQAIKLNSCWPSREASVAAWASVSPASHLRSAPAIKIFSFALTITTALTGCDASASRAARSAAWVAGLNTLARLAGSSKVIQPMPSASTE